MTANQIIAKAVSQVGITEKPVNDVIYNTEYYGRAVNGSAYPWCCAFVWWVFKECGSSDLFYDGGKTASCTTLMNFHKKKGQFVTKYQPGDVVFFNWNGKKSVAQHVGIVESVSGYTVNTIEGNTAFANDTNGGQVMRRKRNMSLIIGGYRPTYVDAISGYKEVIQSHMNLSDPARWFSKIDSDEYAEQFYKKWAESYAD